MQLLPSRLSRNHFVTRAIVLAGTTGIIAWMLAVRMVMDSSSVTALARLEGSFVHRIIVREDAACAILRELHRVAP